MKNNKLFFGLIVSAFCVYLVIKDVNTVEVIESLYRINLLFLLPAVLLQIASFYLRALRWQVFLIPIKKINIISLFTMTVSSFTINYFLPFKIGELIKIQWLGKKDNISRSSVLATVLAEKIYDLVILLIIFALLIYFFTYPAWFMEAGQYGLVINIAIILVIFLLFIFGRQVNAVISKIIKYFPTYLEEIWDEKMALFRDGLLVFKDPIIIIKALVLSFFIMAFLAFNLNCIFYSFGLFELSFYASFFITTVLAIGLAIPSSPGQIGVYEYFVVAGLSLYNIENEIALGIAIISHLQRIITTVALFFVFCKVEGIDLDEIKPYFTDRKHIEREKK